MIEKQSFTKDASRPTRDNPPLRLRRFLGRLFVAIVGGIVKVAIHCAWYLAYYMLCMFRPFTGMMIIAAVIMVPMAIVVFANPEAANGMPF